MSRLDELSYPSGFKASNNNTNGSMPEHEQLNVAISINVMLTLSQIVVRSTTNTQQLREDLRTKAVGRSIKAPM